jgi:alginate O-acetyltransferase complex protein AlgI
MFQSLAFWGLVPLFAGASARLGPKARALLITALSLGLILALNPVTGAWLAVEVVAVWMVLGAAARTKGTARNAVLWAGIALIIANLVAFKYLPTGEIGALLTAQGGVAKDVVDWLVQIGFPLGISFLSFRLIHILVECMRGTLPPLSARDYFLYAFFFPIWIAGPIERVDRFFAGRADRVSSDDLTTGANRVLWGLVKVFFISKTVLPALYAASFTPDTIVPNMAQLGVADTWWYLLVTYAILYTDFSGYSDLAIGLARLFGFKIVENFNFPFLATNMSDYWRRWHISLANWCQSYVYMPVLARTRRPNLALYCSFFVMGLWHAASPNWILWGMWHATGVTVYRLYDRFRRKHLAFINTSHWGVALFNNLLTVAYVSGAGAFTSLHGKAPIADSFALLGKAIGL